MPDWRIKVDGKADPELVHWLEQQIALLRALPPGWSVNMTLERAPAPDDQPAD